MILASLSLISFSVTAEPLDSKVYYRVSTLLQGSMSLDIFNGGNKNNMLRLDTYQIVSGQYWNFVPSETQKGYYRLKSMFRGANLCVDVINGGPNNNQLIMANCGEYSGQYWKIVLTGNNYYKMKTMFRGESMCLNVFDGGSNVTPRLTNCVDGGPNWKDWRGQNWRLIPTDRKVN